MGWINPGTYGGDRLLEVDFQLSKEIQKLKGEIREAESLLKYSEIILSLKVKLERKDIHLSNIADDIYHWANIYICPMTEEEWAYNSSDLYPQTLEEYNTVVKERRNSAIESGRVLQKFLTASPDLEGVKAIIEKKEMKNILSKALCWNGIHFKV